MDQGSLPFICQDEISDKVISACKDMRGAIRLCIDVCGLERKEVAFALNLQESHLSRMLSDTMGSEERHFPVNLLLRLMSLCENDIPLRWLAMQKGYGLFRLKSQLEMENELLQRQLVEKTLEVETMLRLVREMGGRQ